MIIKPGQDPLTVARRCIDTIDAAIVYLMGLRYDIVRKIVIPHKRKKKLPIRDRAREKKILIELEKQAKKAKLRPGMIRRIYLPLLDTFVETQFEPHPVRVYCRSCRVYDFGTIIVTDGKKHRACSICKDPLH